MVQAHAACHCSTAVMAAAGLRGGRQRITPANLAFATIGVQCAPHGAGLRNSARVGSSIRKVEPLPKVDSTQMRPPCISTICLAMARPKPVPPLALVLELSI